MNAPVTYQSDTQSPLRCRKPGGGTQEMTDWYLKSETGPLLDVLLGPVDTFRWLGLENAEYSSLVRDSLRRGRVYDADLARRQHAEMVQAYESAGSKVHFLPVDEGPVQTGLPVVANGELGSAAREIDDVVCPIVGEPGPVV